MSKVVDAINKASGLVTDKAEAIADKKNKDMILGKTGKTDSMLKKGAVTGVAAAHDGWKKMEEARDRAFQSTVRGANKSLAIAIQEFFDLRDDEMEGMQEAHEQRLEDDIRREEKKGKRNQRLAGYMVSAGLVGANEDPRTRGEGEFDY